MTLFAGALSLNTDRLSPALKLSLRANLRSGDDQRGSWCVHEQASFFLVKWDSGAFAEPAWRASPDGSVCALAGDPILLENGRRLKRLEQMARLAPELSTLQDTALAQCRGSFALVHYAAATQTLCLSTDALGLRSIYYVIQDDCLIFATALRVLEAVPEVRKQLSLQGMAELSVFSFPLAERTPYEGLKILRECEVLTARTAGVKMHRYYDWSTQEDAPSQATDAAAQLHATFREAVDARLSQDQRVYSFLSGGMDSRAIVSTLIDRGRQVEALNFSSPASQDQRYALSFATQAGSGCHLHCLPGGNFPNFSFLALAAKTALEQNEPTSVDRPQFIWSGDGGSVGLGHVYMDERMLELGAQGDVKGAVAHFLALNRIALSSRVLTASAREQQAHLMFDSVLSEVHRYPREDVGRRLYLFLLFNDQRRHLFKHFETIDQHGLELLTPFFDAKLLKTVAATPARWGVLHRLYAQLFEHLPAFARRTPWQTYPGHQPCPLPGDPLASYQWARHVAPAPDGLKERGQLALELLQTFNWRMRPQVFSPALVGLAALLHASGLRDCRHVLQLLQLYRLHDAQTRSQQRVRS
ncbi:asparagine synthase-related protein [Rhodoferax sp.]|uniref:asparagine synthase-related protein n=1 Tax=Rhodoferax sp. TaxID=50421 RepID=UPI00374CB79E